MRVIEKTPEQQAHIRRRALPVGIGGSLCGLLGIVLGLLAPVSAYQPPSFVAMNMAFCAMLIGVGILIYARGTPKTGWAAVFSLAAVLMGMAGTAIYARRAVQFRALCEQRELDNLTAIAVAARNYAHEKENSGAYPTDLLVLLEKKLITPENLQSPYGMHDPMFNDFAQAQAAAGSRGDLLKAIETHADYIYLGADLKNVPDDLQPKILTVASANIVLHEGVSAAFADGHAEFLNLEQIADIRKDSDAARTKMGLGQMQMPASIQQALDQAAAAEKGR